MSQSLANLVVHLVFSTKNRRPLLRDEERGRVHGFITGILVNHDSPLIEINSVRDHVHILFAQSKNHAPAKIVEQVKSSSSAWIKNLHPWYADFAWQAGYGEFSVSPIHVEVVREVQLGVRPNITGTKTSKPSIDDFARETANPWMIVMFGIDRKVTAFQTKRCYLLPSPPG